MSMTSEGAWPRRPMNATSLRSNMGVRFAAFMQQAGLQVPKGVSMTSVALLRDMAAAGGTMGTKQSKGSKRASDLREPAACMGLLIKHGFARFMPAARHYELTADGHALLAKAGQTGVLVKLAEFEAILQQAATPPKNNLNTKETRA